MIPQKDIKLRFLIQSKLNKICNVGVSNLHHIVEDFILLYIKII